MFKKILLCLALALVVFATVVAFQPPSFRYSRSLVIAASPETLFAQTNDLRQFQKWNPWAKIDPNTKYEFSGPASGVGATNHWVGNREVGEGKMTISESTPHSKVNYRIEFIKPIASTSLTEFTFQPQGEKTLVTWTMSGKNNFVGKAFALLIDCEKMIGSDFENGLATLKNLSETPGTK